MNSWRSIAEDKVVSVSNFWSGIKVWMERPHLINNKVIASELVTTCKTVLKFNELIDVLRERDFNLNMLQEKIGEIETLSEGNVDENLNTDSQETVSIVLRYLLPKQAGRHENVLEVIVLDSSESSATFFPRRIDVNKSPITPNFPYKFQLSKERLCLEVPLGVLAEDTSLNWLKTKVFPKVSKWCRNVPKHSSIPSIRLLSARDYNTNLCYLKKKYGSKFVKIWPEYNNTDPIKFVYEDISIAAYLITMWAEERKLSNSVKKQTFVDLGCGNGLLVHILSSEGHEGIGVDLRKRKIWDAYDESTKLLEIVVEPSDKHLYPEYDWIIGNHSDELTPWIPVIAARSNYHMKVFLLPCCFYTFNGKYARTHQSDTQYQSYVNFLKELCISMGFQVDVDRLRIPSTKRICLVCTSRTYKVEEEKDIDLKRTEFINSHSKRNEHSSKTNSPKHEQQTPCPIDNVPLWATDYTAREAVEVARNCTQIDKSVIMEAVKVIVNALLATLDFIPIQCDGKIHLWNKGGCLKLADLSNVFDGPVLKCLKNQRGGFQTLLRNHGHIFHVRNNCVQLRIPTPLMHLDTADNKTHKPARKIQKKDIVYQKKPCFFALHHPQGCPLSVHECTFSHSIDNEER